MWHCMLFGLLLACCASCLTDVRTSNVSKTIDNDLGNNRSYNNIVDEKISKSTIRTPVLETRLPTTSIPNYRPLHAAADTEMALVAPLKNVETQQIPPPEALVAAVSDVSGDKNKNVTSNNITSTTISTTINAQRTTTTPVTSVNVSSTVTPTTTTSTKSPLPKPLPPQTLNVTSKTSHEEEETSETPINVTVTSVTTAQTTTEDRGVCSSNPCLNNGLCSPRGKGYSCRCGPLINIQYGGYRCEIRVAFPPVAHSVYPSYGPKAGGTDVTIIGSSLSLPVDSVYLGDNTDNNTTRYRCDVIKKNGTRIMFRTPEAADDDVMQRLPITIEFAGGAQITNLQPKLNDDTISNMTFQYRENPIIENVDPQQTLAEGGTTLYVHGQRLDSVAVPVIKVYMVLKKRTDHGNLTQTDSFYRECTGIKSSTFSCVIPFLRIPERFIRRLDTATTTITMTTASDVTTTFQPINATDAYNVTTDSTNTTQGLVDIVNNRPIRSTDDGSESRINFIGPDEQLNFYLGVLLDGYRAYQDFREVPSLKKYSELDVYLPPVMEKCVGVIEYKEGMELKIKGEYLLRGIRPVDYMVTVGGDNCAITNLNYNTIICTPPSERPERRHGNSEDQYEILVHFGHKTTFQYGFIIYPSPNLLLYILPAVGGVVLVLLIILIAVLARRCHRKRSSASNRKKYTYSPVSRTLPAPTEMDIIGRAPKIKKKDSFTVENNLIVGKTSGSGANGHTNSLRSNIELMSNASDTFSDFDDIFRQDYENVNNSRQPSKERDYANTGKSRKDKDVYANVSKGGKPESNATKKEKDYANFAGSTSKGVKRSKSSSSANKEYANLGNRKSAQTSASAEMLSPGKMGGKRNVPLPEIPVEGSRKSNNHNKQQPLTLTTFAPRGNSPLPDIPVRNESRLHPEYNPPERGRHVYRFKEEKLYNSGSEDEEQIYMNSPIKLQNLRKKRSRSRSGGRDKGATLWY